MIEKQYYNKTTLEKIYGISIFILYFNKTNNEILHN